METLTFVDYPSQNRIDTYLEGVNAIIKPLGIYFEYNEGKKLLEVYKNDDTLFEKYEINASVFERTRMYPSHSEDIAFLIKGLDNDRELLFRYNAPDRKTDINIFDKNKGETTISFNYNIYKVDTVLSGVSPIIKPHKPLLKLDNVIIKMKEKDIDNKYMSISYDREKEGIFFSKVDEENKKVSWIGMSRKDSHYTGLVFFTGDTMATKKIVSKGDEEYHELAWKLGLHDESFEIKYEEMRTDGFANFIDLSQNKNFKHYSNTKLVNNRNVRNYLDEIVNTYIERFPDEDYQHGILGGYLFKRYVTGEPNNRVIANNFLEEVGFPVIKEIPQRTRSYRKDKRRKNNK